MRRVALAVVAFASSGTIPLAGQAVPPGSQADRVHEGYRRTASLRADPFRHVFVPHWGLVIGVGARAANNAVNLRDVGALLRISADDTILVGDVVDVLGLVPRGRGVTASAQGEGGFYLGGPLPGGLAIGVTAQGRGYGAATIDDDAIALLRDGNVGRQEFTVGDSRGTSLATFEYGGHLLLRLGPVYSPDGPRITLGAGARIVRPVFYLQSQSALANGGRILVTGDSIVANISVDAAITQIDQFGASTVTSGRGSGVAADFVARIEWPTNGLALEALVANLGTITVEQVERRRLDLDIATTVIDTVIDEIEAAEFAIVDTADVDVTLPRIVRFSASAWANAILQLDVAATMPVSGDFRSPLAVDIGTTWRFINSIPLRAGLVIGDNQGIGLLGGLAIESRSFLLSVHGQTLGGLFSSARGAAGRFELGFFF